MPIEGHTLQDARPKLADFYSATVGGFCSSVDSRLKLLDPTVDRRSINRDPTFSQKFTHIAVGGRLTTIPAHRQQENIFRETVLFERISTRLLAPLLKMLYASHFD